MNCRVQEQCPIYAVLEEAPRWRLAVASYGLEQQWFSNFAGFNLSFRLGVGRVVSTHETYLELNVGFAYGRLSRFSFCQGERRRFLTENMLAGCRRILSGR